MSNRSNREIADIDTLLSTGHLLSKYIEKMNAIKKLAADYPNDLEFGTKVRALIEGKIIQ